MKKKYGEEDDEVEAIIVVKVRSRSELAGRAQEQIGYVQDTKENYEERNGDEGRRCPSSFFLLRRNDSKRGN